MESFPGGASIIGLLGDLIGFFYDAYPIMIGALWVKWVLRICCVVATLNMAPLGWSRSNSIQRYEKVCLPVDNLNLRDVSLVHVCRPYHLLFRTDL